MKKPPLKNKDQMSLSFERSNVQARESRNVLAFPVKLHVRRESTERAQDEALEKVLSHAQALKRQL